MKVPFSCNCLISKPLSQSHIKSVNQKAETKKERTRERENRELGFIHCSPRSTFFKITSGLSAFGSATHSSNTSPFIWASPKTTATQQPPFSSHQITLLFFFPSLGLLLILGKLKLFMAGIPSEGLGDDFFEQILAVPPSYGGGDMVSMPMGLQLGSSGCGGGGGDGGLRGMGLQGGMAMPLGLNLEQGFLRQERFRDEIDAHNNNNNNNTTNNASSSSTASSGITVNLSL